MWAMGAAEWGMLIALAVLWGGSFFFVGVAVAELPPLTIVALRVGLAALVLHVVVLATGLRMPRDRRAWSAFLAMGMLNNVVPFSLIAWGQINIASGLASILNATTPLFTVLVAHALSGDERISAGRLAGAIVGFAGVAAMIGADALGALGADLPAQLAVLGAALSYAFAGVFGRRFARTGTAPTLAATGQVTASALILAPAALVVETPWTLSLPGAPVLGAVTGLALLSTALAYLLYFRILARAGATNLLVVTFLIPVVAIALGAAILDERLAPSHLAGMALIGLGLVLIDGRLARHLVSAYQQRAGGEGA